MCAAENRSVCVCVFFVCSWKMRIRRCVRVEWGALYGVRQIKGAAPCVRKRTATGVRNDLFIFYVCLCRSEDTTYACECVCVELKLLKQNNDLFVLQRLQSSNPTALRPVLRVVCTLHMRNSNAALYWWRFCSDILFVMCSGTDRPPHHHHPPNGFMRHLGLYWKIYVNIHICLEAGAAFPRHYSPGCGRMAIIMCPLAWWWWPNGGRESKQTG